MAERQVVRYDATLYNFFDCTKYSRSHGYNDEIVTYEIDGEKKILPKAVVKLLELIFDQTSIDRFLQDNNVTSNFLEKAIFGVAGLALGMRMPYYTLNTPSMAGVLNDWFFMRDTRTIMKACKNDPNAIFQYYRILKTKIRPLEKDCNEYKKIVEYVTISHGPTHSKYRLEVMDIFKISRRGEFRRYKSCRDKIGLRKLLWHGSKLMNFASILLKGLQIAPHQAPSTGSMFGKGIYFADVVTKSAQYCGADRNNPVGLVLLAEVALGTPLKLTKTEYITELPKGKDSVKVLGKMQPECYEYTKKAVQIPIGKQLMVDVNNCIQYNEYVVFDVNQILLQYMIQLKFIYN